MDPAIHLANAVREAISKEDGPAAEGLRKLSALVKLNISAFGTGIGLDLSQFGLAKEATLADALRTLSRVGGKRIVLVIDEAQHALTTSDGANALFSLKAARDSLNTDSGLHGLQLIATGSNRDKLAGLVNNRDQAFFGAELSNFPPLGLDYIRWLIPKSKLALDEQATFQVFQDLGSRPEPMTKALKEVAMQIASQGESGASFDPNMLLIEKAKSVAQSGKTDFFNSIAGLPPLQSALFKELAVDAVSSGPKMGVFSAAMRSRLQLRLDAELGLGHGVSTESSGVQNTLDGLREAGLLWRSHRGGYFIEDEQNTEWLNEQMNASLLGQTQFDGEAVPSSLSPGSP